MDTNVFETKTDDLGTLFECKPHKEFVHVRTPFLYPDGGIIDVFVQLHDVRFTVTDLGEALGWLRLQSVSAQRSPKQQRLLQDICMTLGVELFRGQLLLRGDEPAQLSDRILRLEQAAVRVSDLWFTTRTRSVESVANEVADYLQEQQIPFERAVKLTGRSGRDWTIDFQIRTERKSTLVFVLATGSRADARHIAEHVVAGWHDLSPTRIGHQAPRFIWLFDDTADVWSEEDFKLVESISDIGRWSRPDEFVELLAEVA